MHVVESTFWQTQLHSSVASYTPTDRRKVKLLSHESYAACNNYITSWQGSSAKR